MNNRKELLDTVILKPTGGIPSTYDATKKTGSRNFFGYPDKF